MTVTVTENGSNFVKVFNLFGAKEYFEEPTTRTPITQQTPGGKLDKVTFKTIIIIFEFVSKELFQLQDLLQN